MTVTISAGESATYTFEELGYDISSELE
jgi:hypothetical protein